MLKKIKNLFTNTKGINVGGGVPGNQGYIGAIIAEILNGGYRNSYTIYRHCDTVRKGVNLVAKAVGEVPIIIRDTKTKEIVSNKLVEEFLEEPNRDQSIYEFMEDLATYYTMDGNCYIEAVGQRGSAHMYCVPSSAVVPSEINHDNNNNTAFHVSMSTNYGFLNGYFNKQEDGRLLSRNNELYHVRQFTNIQNSITAPSPLEAISHYLSLKDSALLYNVNNFSNGNMMSGILNFRKGEKTTLQQLIQDFKNNKGVAGSGQTYVTNTEEDPKYVPMTANNRDSMTTDLLKISDDKIQSIFGIPDPVFNPDAQKYSNFHVANSVFHYNTVLPYTKKILQGLTKLLRFRGLLKPNEELFYDLSEIKSIKLEMLEALEKQKNIGVNTVDEMRNLLGYEELNDEVGSKLISAASAPVANQTQQSNDKNDSNDSKNKSKQHFIKTLINVKGYSEEKAEELWKQKQL